MGSKNSTVTCELLLGGGKLCRHDEPQLAIWKIWGSVLSKPFLLAGRGCPPNWNIDNDSFGFCSWLEGQWTLSWTVATIPRIYHLVDIYFVGLTWGDQTRRRLGMKELTQGDHVPVCLAYLSTPQAEGENFSSPLGRQEATWKTGVNLRWHYTSIIYTFITEIETSNIGIAMKWMIANPCGRVQCDQ